MSTLLLAAVTAFIFHRTLVRTGSSGRNASLATLAVVLSPLYLMLSATFMTDIAGLFAITICLYGCVRAIEASSDRSAIGWICFAVLTCAVFGTSRQIAWLGNIVMVPCTLWLLRSRRSVLFVGALLTAVSFLFILGCMHWLARQPYAVPVPLIVRPFPKRIAVRQLSYIVLEIPLLVLPVIAAFTKRMFTGRGHKTFTLLAALVTYVAIAFYSRKAPDPIIRLEPTAGYLGGWVDRQGVFTTLGGAPILLTTKVTLILTIVCLAGLLGVIAVVVQTIGSRPRPAQNRNELSWNDLGIVLLPFSIAYLALLAVAVGTTHFIYDRYAIGLLGPTTIALIRLYQERVQPSLPLGSVLLIVLAGAYGVIVTHNNFALDRARVALANELHAKGVPFTSIDGGWDYNLDTELDNSNHINDPLIKVPANEFIPPSPALPGACRSVFFYLTPHVQPIYVISFFSDACYGKAPFAPVQYRPWPLRNPINLYAVRYLPSGR